MAKQYVDLAKKPEYKGKPNLAAVQIALQYRDVNPRTLISYINDLVMQGKLPKELRASYMPTFKEATSVKQDKDIKDREGTQPKKYFAKDAEGDEMSKSTKQSPDLYDEGRDYKKEYETYHSRPEQIERRSSRNKARRIMGDKAIKGKDIGHKDNNPLNNDPKNLRNEDPSTNRREPRLREADEGLWDNINKKRERIKSGSGERMRKKGEKGAPTPDQIQKAQEEACCEDCETESVLIENNQYRVGSETYFEYFNDMRKMYNEGRLEVTGFDKELMEGDLGNFATYEEQVVPLDCPMMEEEEKNPPLNKPKAGGPKKYYVYVRDPSTGNIKKVTWGDTTGLKVKLNDPAARKSFAARHKCDQQKDKTKASYWACNLPRYASQLGLSGGGNFYW